VAYSPVISFEARDKLGGYSDDSKVKEVGLLTRSEALQKKKKEEEEEEIITNIL
jgi:hypothetical protein